jgi:hypothetical protein
MSIKRIRELLEWEMVTARAALRSRTDASFDFFRYWWEAVAHALNRRGIRWKVDES